jgi:hypothetical protein
MENDLRFFEIKCFVPVRMFDIRLLEFGNSRLSESSRRQNPATSGHQELAGAGIRQHNFF